MSDATSVQRTAQPVADAAQNVQGAAKKMPQQSQIPKRANFLLGGLAGMGATSLVQPLDLVKTRMQLAGEGMKGARRSTVGTLLAVVRNEGAFGVYNGLSAALLRQATYTTTRLGVFNSLMDMFTTTAGATPNVFSKIGIGMVAGASGAFIGTPAEISLIRMTADGRLPPEQRRGYKNVFNALIRITREEGVLTLWRGCGPTVVRAMVVNAAQLASYAQAKQMLLATDYFEDNIKCHFTASMVSGFITTVASMPVDIAKTRIQNMKITDGKPEYKGTLDVFLRIVRNEGIFSLWKGFAPYYDVIVKVTRREGCFSLWKGFTPYYSRVGPHTVLTFIFLEQLKCWYLQAL